MTSVRPSRSLAAFKPLALVSALASLSFPVVAQVETGQKLSPITVSESRFENEATAIGATVITSEQIREAGVSNVNEAIRKIGGVYGRQNMAGGSDYQLDLRGFGAFSDQNVVVMVDGIRISDNEQVTAMMSSVPIEVVERIEIVRGGSSVLYGEGATGGTINIITKRGAANTTTGTVVAEVGSFGRRELRASIAKGWDKWSLDANLGSLKTDNYRQNNQLRQDNFSGGLQWNDGNSRVGLRVDSSRQDARFPGSLTYTEYLNDPKKTNSPNDYGSFDMDRYTLSGQARLGAVVLAADLSHRNKNVEFFQFGGTTLMKTEVTQFSPRLRYVTDSGVLRNELVSGFDIAHANRTRSASFANDDFTQRSAAAYVRDELTWNKTRVAVGVRREKFKQEAVDPVSTTNNYRSDPFLNAWTLEGAHEFTSVVTAFAKIGKSYRVSNIDDNAFQTTRLLPQTSQDREIGLSLWNTEINKLSIKFFQHRLKNEILFNPNTYTNINLDPTKRQGIEVEGNMRFTSSIRASAVLQHVDAKFRDGPNQGKEIVLVPKNTATLRLYWQPTDKQNVDMGLQWVDKQRYGGDFDNSCSARIPSYAVVDARYAIKAGTWEFSLTGANLTDRNYFTQAFGTCQSGIYPEMGRSIRFTARKDF